MLPYFRKAEDNERGADEFHGTGGPLSVSDPREAHPLADAYVEAAQQCGYPRNEDFNGAIQEGAGYNQTTMRNGRAVLDRDRLSQPGAPARQPDGRDATRTRRAFCSTAARGRRRVSASAVTRGAAQRQRRGDRRVGRVQLAATAAALGRRAGAAAAVARHRGRRGRAGRRREPQRSLRRPHHAALQGADHAQRRGAQLPGKRRGRPALRVSCATAFSTVTAISAGCFMRAHPASATPDIQSSIALYSADKHRRTSCIAFPGVTGVCTLLRPESRGSVRIRSAPIRARRRRSHPNYLASRKGSRDGRAAGIKAMRRIFTDAARWPPHRARERSGRRNATATMDLLDFIRRARLDHLPSGRHLPHGQDRDGRGR